MLPQPLICVTDVEASSRWYQRLLGCRSAHGGKQYEQLMKGGRLVLQLHSFEVEHHHGAIGNPEDRPYGNGVLLWFEVDDFDGVMQRAEEMGVQFVLPRHRNPPDGDGGPNHWECWMRDPDGYMVVVASPYGTADGTWRPEPGIFGEGGFSGRQWLNSDSSFHLRRMREMIATFRYAPQIPHCCRCCFADGPAGQCADYRPR